MNNYSYDANIDDLFGWRAVQLTSTGKVRKINEDSMMSNSEAAHWAVADGMGGHQAGDLASQMITNNLASVQRNEDFPQFIDDIEDALYGVNQNLFRLAESKSAVIGSTIVGTVLASGHAIVYWAGDSRAYIHRNQKLRQITTDHTVVQELLSAGVITAEEMRNHPEKNVITRAIGTHADVNIDFTCVKIEEGDLLLICSDGIEKEISDPELEKILSTHKEINSSANLIMQETLTRGARDNVSLILIEPVSIKDITRQ